MINWEVMETVTYTVQFEAADEGGYVVHVPALPGCLTQGNTLEDAVLNAQEAIELFLQSLADQGRTIPVEAQPMEGIAIGLTVPMPPQS